MMKSLPCFFMTLLLTACASTTTPVGYYDFGGAATNPPGSGGCSLPPLYVADITSPSALDSNLMLYRLLYDSDQQSHAYAAHRWNMTPAQLLTVRIKTQLAAQQVQLLDNGVANPDGWQLRIELADFSQYFSDATHSYAQLQLRSTLLRANRLVAQSTFTQRADAATPDAPAGAQAMRIASDALIGDLSNWLCKQTKP